MDRMEYKISLSATQADIAAKALVLYRRMRAGAWGDLYDLCILPVDGGEREAREVFNEKILPARNLTLTGRFGLPTIETISSEIVDVTEYPDVKPITAIQEKMRDDSTTIILTKEEAKLFSKAMELYSRLRIGQWWELLYLCLDIREDRYAGTVDTVTPLLVEARSAVYPKLMKTNATSYGVGPFEDGDYAWEIHEVVRYRLAITEHPEGGITVNFSPPMSLSGHELAKCEVV